MSDQFSKEDLRLSDIPAVDAPIDVIFSFALTFNGYAQGGFDACVEIARKRLHGSLSELRTCLFFEQRCYRHAGEIPDVQAQVYIRSLIGKIRDQLG